MRKPFAFLLLAFILKKHGMPGLLDNIKVNSRSFILTGFKPFAFYLLALTFLTACRFNPDMQTPGAGYLQGEWKQDSVTMQRQLVSYSLHNLKFNCDSFFVSIKTFSKTNTGADSCTKSGQWTEYARGVYMQKNDTLHLKGLFCNADNSYKEPTVCFRSGVYEEYFKVIKKTDSVVQFNPTTSVIAINARLIKKNTCHPKPL